MNSGIYAIVNVERQKAYVGSTTDFKKRERTHFRNLRNGNGINIKLQRAFNKYGEGAFAFLVMEEAPYNPVIRSLEDEWIGLLDAKKAGYNIGDATFGDVLPHHPNRKAIIAKRSATIKAKLAVLTKEERQARFGKRGACNGMFGKKRSNTEMKPLREANRKFFEEHGHGRMKGHSPSASTRKKLSEHAKHRIGSKNPFFGKAHSVEAKAKISEGMKGRPCSTLHPIVVDTIVYQRLKDAATASGINSSTLWSRANSKNPKFNNIYFENKPKSVQ